MEQEIEKEVDIVSTTSNKDLEVAQTLIAKPAFKLDSSPSPYKVCVTIFSSTQSCCDADLFFNNLAGWNGGVGCAVDVCSPQQTFPEHTVLACSPAPSMPKHRHPDDFVIWQRGNLGHAPRLLHGVQVPAPVQLWQVSRLVVVCAQGGQGKGHFLFLSPSLT